MKFETKDMNIKIQVIKNILFASCGAKIQKQDKRWGRI